MPRHNNDHLSVINFVLLKESVTLIPMHTEAILLLFHIAV